MTRDENDGRLYAIEIMNWDLAGLDLLVLSACETGRGEETFVGGLRGLPTAINIAGAKRSLLTLWPVDDAGTASSWSLLPYLSRRHDLCRGAQANPPRCHRRKDIKVRESSAASGRRSSCSRTDVGRSSWS